MIDLEHRLTGMNGASGLAGPRLRGAAPTVNLERIEYAVREILEAIGEDPDREGLADTPRRVAKAYAEMFAGLREDPRDHLRRVFSQACDDLVLVGGIDVFSVCEHHLLPFVGKAYVAYLPDGDRVVGLSKIARLVEGYARRPQMQERLTAQVADAVHEELGARGVTVVIRSEHMCMKMRGVRKCQADMTTCAHRGLMRDDISFRDSILNLVFSQMEMNRGL